MHFQLRVRFCPYKATSISFDSSLSSTKKAFCSVSREKIQAILKSVGDKRERNESTAYCLTDAGLTGEETTCKQHASDYCDSIGQMRPSKAFRDCRSACVGDCMKSEQCDWSPAE